MEVHAHSLLNMKTASRIFRLLFYITCLMLCQSCMTAILISSLVDSGPKEKSIKFNEGYVGIGEIKKKEFYNGREAAFYTNSMSPIIQGNITYDKIGKACIQGVWNINSKETLKGKFLISNTPEGFLSAKKNSGKLQISVTDVEEYKTTGFHLKKLAYDRNSYSITCNKLSDATIHRIEAEVNREYVERHGYNNITELLKNSVRCKVIMNDRNTFSGDIEVISNSNNDISIQFVAGTWNLTNHSIKSISVSHPSATTGRNCVTVYLKNENLNEVQFDIESWNTPNNLNGLIQLFQESGKGKLTYSSSDRFDGTYDVIISNDGNINVVPLKGTYTLAGGQEIKDNWLDEYDLTEKEKTYVKRHSTPTSQLQAAKALIIDKRYNEYYSQAESALSRNQYRKAITLYKKAGNYKNAEEMNNKVRDIEKIIEEEERKQRILEKYGTYWGTLVLRKEFTIGMTREMCADMVSTARYEISRSVNQYGGTYESWWYNGADEMVASLLFDNNAFFTAMASENAKQYPYHLEFENNKLVRISYRE